MMQTNNWIRIINRVMGICILISYMYKQKCFKKKSSLCCFKTFYQNPMYIHVQSEYMCVLQVYCKLLQIYCKFYMQQ